MPSQKRRRPGGLKGGKATDGGALEAEAEAVDPSVSLFVQRQREQQAAEREARRAARLVKQRASQQAALLAAKDEAATRVKTSRRQGATGQPLEVAEAAYRAALAELVAFESGERPSWAPADATAVDPDATAVEPDATAVDPDAAQIENPDGVQSSPTSQ